LQDSIEPAARQDKLNGTPEPAPHHFAERLPPMEPAIFDQLEQIVKTAGPAAAIDKLCEELKACKDYAGLFYTLLMKKRVELGVSPIATGSNQDLPAKVHQQFED